MKKGLIVAIICISFLSFRYLSQQSLENTRWEGIVNAPSPIDGILEFKKDTFLLSLNGTVLETMSYKVNGDSLRITKLDGNSPCNDETGIYQFSIKENKLYIKSLDDVCGMRANAFGESYTKQ